MRCFTQLTWINSRNTTFKKGGKKGVENPKGWPRQKLRQKNSTRLKTRKGGLGKSLEKRPWAW